jgi:hypothetical protein
MLFIPMPISSETPRCPNCGKEEEIIETCAHCGHHYEDDSDPYLTFWSWFTIISLTIIVIWILCTVMWWMMDNDPSLLQVIKSQWEFIKGLKIY